MSTTAKAHRLLLYVAMLYSLSSLKYVDVREWRDQSSGAYAVYATKVIYERNNHHDTLNVVQDSTWIYSIQSKYFQSFWEKASILCHVSLHITVYYAHESDKNVSLGFQYPAALMNLGAILHLNGKLQEAEANYLRALQLKPDDTITQSNLRKLWNIMEKQGLRTMGPWAHQPASLPAICAPGLGKGQAHTLLSLSPPSRGDGGGSVPQRSRDCTVQPC